MTSAGGRVVARAVVIATGAAIAKLGVPGEDRLVGKGVSQCASCDAPLLRDARPPSSAAATPACRRRSRSRTTSAKSCCSSAGRAHGPSELPRACERASEDRAALRHGRRGDPRRRRGACAAHQGRRRGRPSSRRTPCSLPGARAEPRSSCAGSRRSTRAGHRGRRRAPHAAASGICAAGNVRQGSSNRAAGAMGDGAAAATALDRYIETGEWR